MSPIVLLSSFSLISRMESLLVAEFLPRRGYPCGRFQAFQERGLDDVYDYTMIYHSGSGSGLLRVWRVWRVFFGGSAGQRVGIPVYESGISVFWKMVSRTTLYFGMLGTVRVAASWLSSCGQRA